MPGVFGVSHTVILFYYKACVAQQETPGDHARMASCSVAGPNQVQVQLQLNLAGP